MKRLQVRLRRLRGQGAALHVATVLSIGLAIFAAPGSAFAQPTRLGTPAELPVMSGETPDIGYDAVNRVFLHVSGAEGRFVRDDGILVGMGPFIVAAPSTSTGVTIAYNADLRSFLATWVSADIVYSRTVTYNGPTPILGAPQQLSFGAWPGGTPSVAYSERKKEFLVVWVGDYETDGNILGRRIRSDGVPLGNRFQITAVPGDWELDPALAYSRTSDEFMMAFAGYNYSAGWGYAAVQPIPAGAEAPSGAPVMLQTASYIRTPSIDYNPVDRLFAVAWHAPTGTLMSTVNDAGAVISGLRVVAVAPTLPGVDVAFNARTSSFLVVSWSSTQPLAVELTRLGAPTSSPVTVADFMPLSPPRAAANGHAARWMVVTGALNTGGSFRTFRQEMTTATPLPVFPLAALSRFTPSAAPPYFKPVTLTWTAVADLGAPLMEYQFHLYDEYMNQWSIIQQYSADPSLQWTPVLGGRYALQVWARNAGSSATYESYLGTGMFDVGSPFVEQVAIAMNPTGPLTTGEPITFTARARGGRGPIQYRFTVRNSFNAIDGQDWSSSNTFRWTPLVPENPVTVVVEAMSAGDSAFAGSPIPASTPQFAVAAAPYKLLALTPDRPLPTAAGYPINFRAVTSGPGGAPEIKFLLFTAATNTWSVLQNYSLTQFVNWTPTAGTYAVQVWMRQPGTTVQYDAWLGTGTFTIGSTPAQVLSFVSTQTTFPVPAYTNVTFTARASGGSAPLLYRFLLYQPSTGWIVAQEYSSAFTFTYQPVDGFVNAVQVWVRSSGSTVPYEAYASSGFFGVKPF